MNHQVVSLQFAIFFREAIQKPYAAFEDINRSMMAVFDGQPQMMDLPPMLPADVPLITYRAENQEYVCNISRARIDLHVQRISEEKSNAEVFCDFNAKTELFVKYVLSKTEAARFGMICRYFFPSDDAITVIQKKYLKNKLSGLSELNIRFNKPTEFDSLRINDIVEISATQVVINGKNHDGIFVQRDINNQPQEGLAISLDQLEKISRQFAVQVSEASIQELIK